jgi:hypothetical protein
VDTEETVESGENWKAKTLMIGAVLGALTGLGAAYMLVQRAENEQTHPQLSAGEGVKIGLLLLGVLRQFAQLGEGD